ncbi:MAG: hypothetical protein F6K47_23760 [Symploca sp. SIO2E6]|nr:hypothetical protein [Symploca sp. SIO2E6]
MAENLISTNVSAKQLKFKPGGTPTSFAVSVMNNSDRFASFQVEVLAAAADSHQSADWYKISPEVSSKNPPGDLTQFNVVITDTPKPGFVGMTTLTVRIFSIELREESREVLRLTVEEGTGNILLELELPVREFRKYPGEQIDIPIRVYNPSQLPTNVLLKFLGFEPSWLISGQQNHLQVPPGEKSETSFSCQLPFGASAPSQVYPFTIEATHTNGPLVQVEGIVNLLPMGSLDFSCYPEKHRIPSQRVWAFWRSEPVEYELQFENASNLLQQVNIAIAEEEQQQCTLEVIPEAAELEPESTSQLSLVAQAKRPWLGRMKQLLLPVSAVWSDRRVDTRNEDKNLELIVLPVVPFWLQVGVVILLLWLAWSLSWLNPANSRHKKAVNSVEFNGVGENFVSSSTDQTIIEWNVKGFSFFQPLTHPKIRQIGKDTKAIRVVRYKPVDNNMVAAGLENGEIHLWDVVKKEEKPMRSFFLDKADRVFALEFTQSSRYLFSGHGSGRVFQWNILDNLNPLSTDSNGNQQTNPKQFDFSIYGIKLLGQNDSNLVVAGRNNQLVVWNWQEDKLRSIPYPRPGSQSDYIDSLDTSFFKPNLLVTADNQGYITLWDLQTCLGEGTQPCGTVIDQWSNGHGGKPVRSVALSNDGCYLASAGDDGKMMFWPLTADGTRAEEFLNGKEVGHSSRNLPLNSIDIKEVDQYVLIASGSDDTRVRVKKVKQLPKLGCDVPLGN